MGSMKVSNIRSRTNDGFDEISKDIHYSIDEVGPCLRKRITYDFLQVRDQ